MVGGTGGSEFNDPYTTEWVKHIELNAANELEGISCVYGNRTKTQWRGGKSGRQGRFAVDKRRGEEAITRIYVWHDGKPLSPISGVQFQTNTARRSQKYGHGAGNPVFISGNNGKRERALMGFKGRSGDQVNALEPIWCDTDTLLSKTMTIGPPTGGQTGVEFNMLKDLPSPFTVTLKQIKIRAGNQIESIECEFHHDADPAAKVTRSSKSRETPKSGPFGGKGGREKLFTLDDGEHLIRISGRSSDAIDQLQFHTNKGRSSEVYGGTGGTEFQWAALGMRVVFFVGRSEKRLVNLQAVLIPITK